MHFPDAVSQRGVTHESPDFPQSLFVVHSMTEGAKTSAPESSRTDASIEGLHAPKAAAPNAVASAANAKHHRFMARSYKVAPSAATIRTTRD
jgi:hypothetical protein